MHQAPVSSVRLLPLEEEESLILELALRKHQPQIWEGLLIPFTGCIHTPSRQCIPILGSVWYRRAALPFDIPRIFKLSQKSKQHLAIC